MSYTFTAPIKDPQAVLRHSVSWVDWLQDGETIQGRTVTAPSGMTIDQVSDADGKVSYRIAGGVVWNDYVVTCQITTSLGRVDERSVLYRIRER